MHRLKVSALSFFLLAGYAGAQEITDILSIPLSEADLAQQLLCDYVDGEIEVSEATLRSFADIKVRKFLVEEEPAFEGIIRSQEAIVGAKPYIEHLCEMSLPSFTKAFKEAKFERGGQK